MPRIQCRDGISFSAQATDETYAIPVGWKRGDMPHSDIGPWQRLEVAFLSIETPEEWRKYFVENHWSAYKHHDHGDFGEGNEIIPGYAPVYSIPVDDLEQFVAQHGGEADPI